MLRWVLSCMGETGGVGSHVWMQDAGAGSWYCTVLSLDGKWMGSGRRVGSILDRILGGERKRKRTRRLEMLSL